MQESLKLDDTADFPKFKAFAAKCGAIPLNNMLLAIKNAVCADRGFIAL